MKNSRETVVRCLTEVFDRAGYSQLVLDSAMRRDELSAQDRAFCSALFYGVVERRITLDWVIGQYSRNKVEELSPAVREILRSAFYQLMFMPSVPESAVVDEAVKLCRTFRMEVAAGFVNGTLRTFLRAGCAFEMPKHSVHALSVQYSIPEELLSLWNTVYGKEKTLAILLGCHTPPPVFARVNPCRTDVDALIARLADEGVTAEKTTLPHALRLQSFGDLHALPAFCEGLFHIQDLSSQRCAEALEAAPGMRVLDVCSAPGGKSFTLAEIMNNEGELLCCDSAPNRLHLVREGAQRLGLSMIKCQTRDASVPDDTLGLFDRILCDVPCSGYGVLRRKPEIRYKPLAEARELPALQKAILTASAAHLAPGGRLIYSTCTLNPGENALVVRAFLAEHPDFEAAGEAVTSFPEREGGDGFFYAPLRRKA